MLREALRYLRTPCSKDAKALGYLYEAVAFQARAERCRAHWAGHIANCHAVIGQAIRACSGSGAALVCGSGLLLETPMAALLDAFDRVDCLDIVQPRRPGTGYPPDRVRRLEADITGVIAPIAAAARGEKAFDADQPPPVPELGRDYDLVVSCNLASQLPLLPRRALAGLGGYGQSRLDAFGRNLVATHLRWLACLPGVACLIADTARQYDRTDAPESESEDALFGLQVTNATATWWWDIAPAPELERNLSQRNRVAGVAVFTGNNIVEGVSSRFPASGDCR
jgi:hypothetical protein